MYSNYRTLRIIRNNSDGRLLFPHIVHEFDWRAKIFKWKDTNFNLSKRNEYVETLCKTCDRSKKEWIPVNNYDLSRNYIIGDCYK